MAHVQVKTPFLYAFYTSDELGIFGHTFYIIYINLHYRTKFFFWRRNCCYEVNFRFPAECVVICHISIHLIHLRYVVHGENSRGVPNDRIEPKFPNMVEYDLGKTLETI